MTNNRVYKFYLLFKLSLKDRGDNMNNIIAKLLTLFLPYSDMRKEFRRTHDLKIFSIKSFNEYYIKNYLLKIQKNIIKNKLNPLYFEFMQNLNKFTFEENISTMEQYIVDRIPDKLIYGSICYLEQTNSDKEILLLTDKENTYNCKKININEISNFADSEKYIFLVAYNKDYLGLEAAKIISDLGLKYQVITQGTPTCKYYHTDKYAYECLMDEWMKKDRKAHFSALDFENIFQAIKQTQDIEGDFVEIGTYQGASARAALNYMKRAGINRKAYFFDTYEGFTYEEAQNSEDTYWKNTHTETSLQTVKNFLSEYDNANCIKSNIIKDELPSEISKIAVANIDVDMYEAVKAALYKVKDRIVQYGIILAEDYGHTPFLLGANKAVSEFLEENPNQFISIISSAGQMIMIKK